MKRLNDYFAEEAADYLEQLDRLLTAPATPDSVHVLRLATGVQGSIRMAGADQLAELAGNLQQWAGNILDGYLDLADEHRELAHRTVREMHTLVRRLDGWTEDDADLARALAGLWHSLRAVGRSADDARGSVPIEALFYDDAGPHIIEHGTGASGVSPHAVPIDQLLYRGQEALHAALALRPAIERSIGAGAPGNAPDLLDELFDLIALGLTAESADT